MNGTDTKVDRLPKPSLKDSEIRYRRLFEAAQDGILILDAETGVIDDVNPYLITLLGYSRLEFIEKKLWEVGAFKDITACKEAFLVLQKDEYIRYKDLPLKTKDGRLIPVEFVSNVYEADGKKVIQCNIRDNTERKLEEEARLEREELYRTTLERMTEGFQIIGKDYLYLFVNDSAAGQGKRKKEELLGKTMMECYPGIEKTDMFSSLQNCMNEHCSHTMVNEFIFPDGSKGWFELHMQPVPNGILILSSDITERRRAEAASRQLVAIVEASDDAIIGQTLDGVITSWNIGAQRMYGYTAAEAIGRSISFIVPPDRINELSGVLSQLHRGEKVVHLETIRIRKDNVQRDVALTISLIPDGTGQAVIASSISRDITERRQAQEDIRQLNRDLEQRVVERTAALSQANMLLETLLDTTPDQIYFKDSKSRYIKNSRAQAQEMGLSNPSDMAGKSDFDFFPHAQLSYDKEVEIMQTGKPVLDIEEWVIWPDGHGTWVSTTKAPLRDQANKIIGTFGISRDITGRKRNEEALEKANKELEAFSYSVSHDLRAPLRAIDGFSRILMNEYQKELPAEANRYLGLVRSQTQRMGELVDDLLAFSRLSRQPLSKERLDPANVVRQVLVDMHTEQAGRQVEIVIGDLPSCEADPALLKQVFVNLLANAIKFTRTRPVAHIEVGSEQKDGACVYFVRDDGVGFDMKYVGKLFGVFQRLHRAEDYEGTGVGLAIVQRIVDRHGGRVWAEGETDRGATFYFTL